MFASTGWTRAGFLGLAWVALTMFAPAGWCQPPRRPRRDRPRIAVVPQRVRAVRDLVYGSAGGVKLQLDLYLPHGAKRPPLLVWIHGGGWRRGNKAHVGFFLPMTAFGYAVASIDYRLSDEATFPAQIHDCKAAIRWLRAHADKYGYDARRIGVGGSSAGGHLAALLGTSGGVPELEGKIGKHLDQSSRVQAVFDGWGPTDFVQLQAQRRALGWPPRRGPASAEVALIGGPLEKHPDKVRLANPITHVDRSDPPFLILHGGRDRLVPPDQSRLLRDALQKAGVEVTLTIVPEAGHGGRELRTREHLMALRRFFDRHVRRPESESDAGKP